MDNIELKKMAQGRYWWLRNWLENAGSPKTLLSNAVAVQGMTAAQVRAQLRAGLEAFDYEVLRNPGTKDGRWKINKQNIFVYVKKGETLDLETLVAVPVTKGENPNHDQAHP